MVRRVLRLLGALLLLAGVVLLGRDLLPLARGDGFAAEALGNLWHGLDADGLRGVHDAMQRPVLKTLWDGGVVWLLAQPAFVVAIVFGALLLLVTRGRARARGFR
jgi:hypothetical protein